MHKCHSTKLYQTFPAFNCAVCKADSSSRTHHPDDRSTAQASL